jgi:flavin-dependent dehydrogenase
VGIVAEKDYLFSESKDPAEIMAREIQRNAWIADHLSQGEQYGQYFVTAEFSYRAKHPSSDGLLLAGDAFAFLDPVFSSGVFLALKSGELAADAVDAALKDGDTSGARFAAYGEVLCKGIENMRKLVYAFYDENFSFGKMIKAHPDQRAPLTDCLIGDLFDLDFSALHAAMRNFAKLPAELTYGRAPATQAA